MGIIPSSAAACIWHPHQHSSSSTLIDCQPRRKRSRRLAIDASTFIKGKYECPNINASAACMPISPEGIIPSLPPPACSHHHAPASTSTHQLHACQYLPRVLSP